MSCFRSRTTSMFVFVLILLSFLVPAQVALAQDPWTGNPPGYIQPLPPVRARVNPPPIPVPLPKAGSSNIRRPGEESAALNQKSTVNQTMAIAGSGKACLDFEGLSNWGSTNGNHYKLWDDQFGGWGPFAVDDGGLYEIENVHFDREESIRAGQYSFKIASTEPYAAGLASPIIKVTPGVTITVKVRYYIWNHGQTPKDWASLGVKGNAFAPCSDGCYVNGYTRGRWATLTSTVTATSSKAMILLQAESPLGVNSNIYFDDLEIQVDGAPVTACKLAAP